MLIGAPVSITPAAAAAAAGDAHGAGDLLYLRLSDVHRNEAQPRTQFCPDAIHSLATSIQAHGVIQPIAVRPRPAGGYEIIAGERRWLAAQQAGLERVPAVLHDVDERSTLVLALVENLVRQDLAPLETARAYAVLHDEFAMTVADVARSVGRSRPAVANTLRLLELPDDILAMLERRELSEGHGRALLGCTDRLQAVRLARQAASQRMSVRALEQAVRDREDAASRGIPSVGARRSKWNREPAAELVAQADEVAERLPGVRARVRMGDAGAKLELHCDSVDELVALITALDAGVPRIARAS
jgi:ParB family chromosome partitioning protein